MQDIALASSLVVMIGMLCQWLAWRVRLPAILFLLVAGLVVGPVLGWLNPDELFGDLLMPMVSLSVAIILFEGSLTLNLKEVREVSVVVQRMVSIGALITWVIVAIAAYAIFDFSWQVSALFGAVVIVTGPTVIIPMLRSVRPTRKIANILRWEGIAIDPVGALMAVMTYEFILASAQQTGLLHVLQIFMLAILTGLVLGIVSGYVLSTLLENNLIPEYLQNIATLSVVLVAFTCSNALTHESGLLTVTIMGMWLANRPDLDIHPILNFKEHLSILLISVLFILLAARVDLDALLAVGWQALLLLLVLQFIARPAKVFVSTLGQDLSWQEKGLLAWIAPRGIVAAAISAIFAERLVAMGYEDAKLLVPLTFSVIVGTVVLQSATARFVARKLGVAEPEPKGFLIIGANTFARAIGAEFSKLGLRCVLADSNWDNIRQARMQGLETFYGNAVSQHADIHLDMSGIGNLLALSHQRYVNIIAAIHYSADFGERRIFRLASSSDHRRSEKHTVSSSHQGSQLFGEKVTYSEVVNKVNKGAKIKVTSLTEEFDWNTYRNKYAETRMPLFVVDQKQNVTPFTVDKKLQPGEGSTILALVVGDEESLAVEKKEAEKKEAAGEEGANGLPQPGS
ncbi:MAG: cation:proton antiporter [Gammaproteobacteria bacterium]|nr:cation:proton antiporter [Gammaproteobacteria bacterium]NND38685.1 sodium:proton antiporter [Pseudomonadales bacterium]MBT8149862.1 cation:proton antiporter [Gammaproteobacteria bacterium]NNL11903.1 sodium:proton antiporter [Pseudomonadales bacterium]NNM11011.1 sodium:proton antiporter [Pseudomonadales bacterium]